MANSVLAPPHRYAVGGLFALALHQAHVHQTRTLGLSTDKDAGEDNSSSSSSSNNGDSALEDPQLWVHESSGLLRPVFRILHIDSEAWPGLEKIGGSSSTKHHAEVLLKLLSEEDGEPSAERLDQELALTKAVDAMMMSMEPDLVPDMNQPASEATDVQPETAKQFYSQTSTKEEECNESGREYLEEPLELQAQLSYNRKVTVLYELLSACLANTTGNDNKSQKGYDARHRVALRLLATWLDFKWTKMEAMEVMVACSAMALMKEEGKADEEEINLEEGTWAKWKRGGIIGAAAVTGGTLLAVTGGLAAPAIAAGFSALAPTLGTLVPVIGASGFAAAASAAGSVAGSVAVAASFGAAGAGLSGTKMAKRIGSIDEFEFKPVGDNHNQGRLAVGILVSGLVFEEEDFVRPWKGQDNLERYALQWESKNLIAVSTAIQDWLTSRIAIELMKQGSMMTVLNALVSALAWPATLLQATDFIDNKWSVAVDRSDKAGKLLAEVLSNGLQGNRPVTLIGFSLGARVIFKCLQSLAETEDNAGLIERVVLLGAPIAIEDENWDAARKMVAGRFVNAYSTNDWTLGFAFRASLLTGGLAGIQPVDVPGIENVDVTELIEGHSSYIWTTQQILQQLELETYYPFFRSSLVELQNNEIGKDPEI